MYNSKRILFLHCITPLHAGSGNDLGLIDLPIQREKHTDFPKVESSGLKGSLREAFEQKLNEDDLKVHLAFGYDEDADKSKIIEKKLTDKNNKNTEFAGALAFSDVRLFLFPVKSAKEVFVWVTCPYSLKRFKEELNLIGISDFVLPNNSGNLQSGFCIAANDKLKINDKIILEEYAFHSDIDNDLASSLAEFTGIADLKNKLVVVSNDDFKSFVTLSTEVITRTKIDNETGTVKDGALFNEEYLPAETVMYSMIFAANIFNQEKGGLNNAEDVMSFFTENLPPYFQLGGNASTGKGIVKTKVLGV